MASALDLGKTNLFGKPVDLLQMNLVQSYSIIGIIVLSLLFAFLGFLFACFYNTFSRIGFNLDLGLVPVEQKQKEIKEQPTTEITPTIEPAPVSNQTPQPTTPNNFY